MEKIMSDQSHPSFENVIEELGMPGRFQMTQFGVMVTSKFIVVYMTVAFVFLGYGPPHVCNSINETSLLHNGFLNDSSTTAFVKYGACDVIVSTNQSGGIREVKKYECKHGRNFSGAEGTTFLTDWDLVCESSGIAEWSQTFFIIGQVVGGLITAQITDIVGRKPVFLVSCIAVCLLEFGIAAAPNIYVIYALKFFSGFFLLGILTTYLVHGMELLVPRHRQIFGVCICYLWVLQVVVIGGVAYLLQDYNWRYLQGFIAVSGLPCIIYPFFLSESPRWLAANNRLEDTLVVIKKACKQNKKDFGKVKHLVERFIEFHQTKSQPLMAMNELEDERGDKTNPIEYPEVTTTTRESLLTIFKSRHILKITLMTFYIWLTCNLTYYGLYMTSSSISGDRFLNFILMALVEIPGNAAILVMLNRMSRRLVLMFFIALTAVSFIISSICLKFASDSQGYSYLSSALFIFGKFTIGSAYNVIFILTPEIFPTNLRGVGTGFCSSFGRMGSMIAPFLRPLFQVAQWAPGLIFAVMCIISLILIPFLPETKDKGLSNNIEEMEREQKKTEGSSLRQ